jgi:hypothetical protein
LYLRIAFKVGLRQSGLCLCCRTLFDLNPWCHWTPQPIRPIKHLAVLLFATLVLFGFQRSSSGQCVTLLSNIVYNPHCDNTSCTQGGAGCSHCVIFGLRNDCSCCVDKFDVSTSSGTCYIVCGTTDVPTHPSWGVNITDCNTAPGRRLMTTTSLCSDCPSGGLCPGKTLIMEICSSSAASFTIVYTDCSGNPHSLTVSTS